MARLCAGNGRARGRLPCAQLRNRTCHKGLRFNGRPGTGGSLRNLTKYKLCPLIYSRTHDGTIIPA